MDKILINKVKKYVGEVLREADDSKIHYHNFAHTAEVVKVIDEISNALNLSDQDKEILLIAGWFHDIGYTKCYDDHEDLGIEIAKDFLFKNKYPVDKSNSVLSLINATRLPRDPKNLLEEIICDSDLHHIGTIDFSKKERLFRKELEDKKGCIMSDKRWLENNVVFLKQHKFYTTYAKEKFGHQKKINLNKVQQELASISEKL